MKKTIAILLICLTLISLCSCGKSEAVKAFDAMVAGLGEVSVESESALADAQAAFDALSDADKEQAKESADKLVAIKASYDELISKNKIDAVIVAIDALGTITLESKAAVKEAKTQYNALSAEEKTAVTNYSTLETAETTLKDLAKAEKEKAKNEYAGNFNIDEDKVENVAWYMHKNMPYYIDTRCYIIPYLGIQGDNAWICIRYNYTDDNWVFWEKLSIVVDGEKYIKSVSYYDTVRDNDGGYVWEYYDEPLNINASMDTKEIAMLSAIADSNETIIRFQGDEYSYDYTVTSADKNMIKDVLALYSAYAN